MTHYHGHHITQAPAQVTSPENARLMRLATYASVAVASVLIVAKIGAWLLTDSVSLLSSLLDSVLDVAASLVNLFAVRHALEPADAEHRFGHGKAEPLAGLAQAAFIGGSAVFLLVESGRRLWHPRIVENGIDGIAVMVFSIVLTLGLVLFQRHVAKKTGSVAVAADSLHYKTDLLVNLAIIVSLWLASEMDLWQADPIFALVIALYILKGAWEIVSESLDLLMDKELPEEDRMRIQEIALDNHRVLGAHDLKTRSSGQQVFIQLHIELDSRSSLMDAHDVAEEVEHALLAEFEGADIIIHQDPMGIQEPRQEF